MTRIEWGEFEYDGRELLFGGHARMPPEQLPSFLLTADGDDRPHAWWIAQTRLYELKTSPAPSVREIRELLAQAIRHGRLVVPEVLRQAERDADAFLRLSNARDGFARRHNPPPTPRTSPPPKAHPATPSRPSSPPPPGPSPRPSQSSPGAMSLQGMLAHPTLMSLPLAAPVPVPSPTPHAMPLFTLVPQPGGIPVPAPGPNPPPLVPAYARYAAYTTTVVPPRANYTPSQTAASSPTPQHSKPEDDDHSSPAAEIDELDEDASATRPASKNGPAPPADAQPDRPKKRSRPTRAHPSSPRVCTTCSRTDSPEWRRGPYGPKTLCNACGLKWAKASGAGRRRGGQPAAPAEPWKDQYPPTFSSNPAYPPYPPPEHPDRRHEISRPGTADGFARDRPEALARSETAPELSREPRAPLAPLAMSMPPVVGPSSAMGSGHPPSSAPIGAVPPPPRSVNGSDSDERVKVEGDVKSESDAASGLMDLANVALESRQDPPSLKRPRADSGYDVGRGRPYDTRHPYVDSRSFSDSRAFDPPTGSGVRQIDVIPIGGDKW